MAAPETRAGRRGRQGQAPGSSCPPPRLPQLPVAPGAPGLVAAPLPPLLLLCVCLSSSVPYEDTVLAQRPPAPRGPHLTVLAPVRSARPLFQIKPCSQLLTSDAPGAPRSPPQAPPPRGFLPQKPVHHCGRGPPRPQGLALQSRLSWRTGTLRSLVCGSVRFEAGSQAEGERVQERPGPPFPAQQSPLEDSS